MARRLALMVLLAAAVAARRPRPRSSSQDLSDSEPDPFVLWDDYDDSLDTTPKPRIRSTPVTKVILRGKTPKVNVTVKNSKPTLPNDKFIKTTNIKIESHTNFIVTKKPPLKPNSVIKKPPTVQIDGQYIMVHAPEEYLPKRTTKKPTTTPPRRRPPTTKRTTTRRPTVRPTVRTPKTTKAPPTRKTTCPPKNPGWLSSFFHSKKPAKKTSKKPAKSGFFTQVYDWIMAPKSWFGGSWFSETPKRQPITTTAVPFTTTPKSWFHNFLDSEDSNDVAYLASDTSTIKKSAKRPLKKNYKGFQLVRTYPDAKWKVQNLLELQEEAQGSGLMWWTAPTQNGSTDILVPPDLLADVKDHLKSSSIDFEVVIWDLQKAIMYENPRLSKKQRLELEQVKGHPMTWRRYHRYADMLRYLEYLQHSRSDIVELIPLGRSSEGLPLVAVKISLPRNDSATKQTISSDGKKKWRLRSRMKPAVWIDGGAHAREWIAPAVASWMIHSLVEGENESGGELEVLKQADFYIMPLVNPDGYEHSHTHDRLWMKTRSRTPDHSDDYYVGWFPWNWGKTECVGADADRNWDYHWGEQDSSKDPCSENYAGAHPFSEPETRAVSDFLSENKGLIKVFISLHAYSQSWLIPSSNANVPVGDDAILLEMGNLATAALSDMYGTKYQVGTVADVRQPSSGMAHDWAKSRAGIKFSYHVDLRDSLGPYGFLLPGSQIVSTARETWQAVKTIVDNLGPNL